MSKILHPVKTLALVFCGVVGVFALYQHFAPVRQPVLDTVPRFTEQVTIGKVPLTVALADTNAKRAQGLSGTMELERGQAMLFLFDTPQRPHFWMKDMIYSLDIVWIGQTGRVLDITENADPKDFPQTYAPNTDIMYVLEVPAGFVKANGIHVGSVLVRN